MWKYVPQGEGASVKIALVGRGIIAWNRGFLAKLEVIKLNRWLSRAYNLLK